VRNPELNRNASWQTIQENIPEGYRIREGINVENYTEHWSNQGEFWDVLEEIPQSSDGDDSQSGSSSTSESSSPEPEPPPLGNTAIGVGGQIIRDNPAGATITVPDTVDDAKLSRLREGVRQRTVGRNTGP